MFKTRFEAHDAARDITKKAKVDVSNFKGRVNPTRFANWLESIEEYFDWYDMNDKQRVRFVRMKLVGLTKVWWTGV